MGDGQGSFSRRVLLAVTGLSPQVITETLYAVWASGRPQDMPNEVHLLTTAQGAERARLALLSDDPGWFHRLVRDFDMPPIAFDASHIHVLRDADGRMLDDIRSPEENLACADFIAEQVRSLSADPDTMLHVSIAGGRKTMGFFLGYALSLFGRPQDRLSHVLVSEPFESTWEFFYPTPYSRVIETRDRSIADTRDARVTLAEIPFVSLRHSLPERLLAGAGGGFRAAVDAARDTVGPPRLEIEQDTCMVTAGGHRFRLAPANLALLSVFARRVLNGESAIAAPPKSAADQEWAERYLQELRRIGGPLRDLNKTERALASGMEGEFFSSRLSNMRKVLVKALGATGARPYLVEDGERRPRCYRLDLLADEVCFVSPASKAPRDPQRRSPAPGR